MPHITQTDYAIIVKELTLGHIGADIVRAVKSNKFQLTTGMIVVIGLIVIVVGVGGYLMTRKPVPVQPQAQSTGNATIKISPVGENNDN
jgi:hypothetical protein